MFIDLVKEGIDPREFVLENEVHLLHHTVAFVQSGQIPEMEAPHPFVLLPPLLNFLAILGNARGLMPSEEGEVLLEDLVGQMDILQDQLRNYGPEINQYVDSTILAYTRLKEYFVRNP